jgi:hypothetical protein
MDMQVNASEKLELGVCGVNQNCDSDVPTSTDVMFTLPWISRQCFVSESKRGALPDGENGSAALRYVFCVAAV